MKCLTTTSHTQLDDSYYTHRTLKILMCSRCDFPTVLLYEVEGNEDQEEESNGSPIEREWERLILYGPKRQVHQAVPNDISEVFNQAEAILASSPRASFILCRKVLEEICTNFGIPTEGTNNKGKPSFVNLHERLTQLFQKEMIPADLQDVIQGIKELGNEGAHSTHATFTKQVTSQEAEKLLAVLDFVIYSLYVHKALQQEITEKLNNLKAMFSP
ncbi:DUF4145 domain-containing protein [Microcoleus sp. FACHB-831]|uniref:DUF4145 domain-containing protein n=1 Tax=Microcoleus sp. FACHB-831 TaxID=2692827 RepID=UPI00168409F3|nr:DUF4145 domain-containing protein [Microcoleus sp. FACHB-831]MBD1920015.1 DUF4145 domain-containing protein [Microcoleus sp. FACHB-831]